MNTGGSFYYSLFSAIAYAVAFFLFYLEARRKKYDPEKLLYILFGSLSGALIGSRLGSVFFVYWGYYSRHLADIFLPQLGGKTLVGGLLGGYLGVVVSKRLINYRRPTGDLFAPGLALGIAIGRIGCFINGCCYGLPTDLPWGVFFKGVRRHPTQIYESIFCFIFFVFLWSIRKKTAKEGDLFKIFLLGYAFFRFWIEFIRSDAVAGILNLSLAQLVCLGLIAWTGVHLFFSYSRNKKTRTC
jgi:phosphatidylglycerol---prolipoprotein diacylglyceryl transferase